MTRAILLVIDRLMVAIGFVLFWPALAIVLLGAGVIALAAMAHDYIYLPINNKLTQIRRES